MPERAPHCAIEGRVLTTKERAGLVRKALAGAWAANLLDENALDAQLAIINYEATVAALVHCADCRFWIRIEGNEGDCTAHKHSVVSKGDCYCSWGERKDA